jgi:AAA domain
MSRPDINETRKKFGDEAARAFSCEDAKPYEGKSNGPSNEEHESDDPGWQASETPLVSLNEIDAGEDPGPIPPRGWLLANQFCRRFLSSLIATGGTGKTALRLLQYLALATGRALTGEHVFRRSRVLLLSFEDDIDELNRRLAAALIHHRIDRAELKDRLFIAAPKGIKLAEMHRGSHRPAREDAARCHQAPQTRHHRPRPVRETACPRGER